MATIMMSRPTEVATGLTMARRDGHTPSHSHTPMDDPASPSDITAFLQHGEPFPGSDSDSFLRPDLEVASIRSHPSSHMDQSLLPRSPTVAPTKPSPQRLQRRRNQYYYFNGTLVPAATAKTAPPSSPPHPTTHIFEHGATVTRRPPEASSRLRSSSGNDTAKQHKRSKSHTTSAYNHGSNTSSWLLGGAGFADAKRHTWTGEPRPVRKLQKDHPMGSARPSFALEISDGDEATGAAERDGTRGSVLGVRRKMERLRGLYRKGEKEVASAVSTRR